MATVNQVSTGSGGTWSTSIVGLDTDSTTSSRPTTSSTSTMTSNAYLSFNCSSVVPAGATITAISASIKIRAYGSTRAAYYQLYNGTTSISSQGSTTSTSTSNIVTINATSIPSSVSNLRIYFRTTSTSTTYRPYVYGAHITITYQLANVNVTYTKSGDGTVTQTPSGTSLPSGTTIEWLLEPDGGQAGLLSLTDNRVNVKSQCTHPQIIIDPGRAVQGSDFTLTNRSSSYTWTQSSLTFTSALTGNSVRNATSRLTTNFTKSVTLTLTIKWNTANTGDYLYVGNMDTALSTSTTQPSSGTYQYRTAGSTSSVTYNLTVPAGSHYFELYHYHAKSNSNRTCTVVISGNIPPTIEEDVDRYIYTISATSDHALVVTFASTSQDAFFFKQNGSWIKAVKVYKKINNVWVEQSDLSQVFDPSVHYQKGN